MKLYKKIFLFIGIIIFSIVFTFVVAENLSWYHFRDIPTRVVLNRLILFFCFTNIVILFIIFIINKLIKKIKQIK